MPLQEKNPLSVTREPDMTTEDKNMHLSAKLAIAPYKKMQIVRIYRIEIGRRAGGLHIALFRNKIRKAVLPT